MSTWIVAPSAAMIDPAIAPEFYVDGIGAIEISGGNLRLHLVSDQMPFGADSPNRIVVVKIVGPLLNVPQVIGQLAQCLWRETARPIKGPWPRAVP